ncbi:MULTISPECIES: hypothetical protein [unclassified Enterobacter]|uniref:hypothetical protein n=1 Tax=unclassified Enterobacter TaxID=2608935 RepID=UPI001C8571B4|nr:MULTISPECIES: hypothetical protein [unclassified Enterobacter]
MFGGSEDTTTELANIFGNAAISNAAGIAAGIGKSSNGSSVTKNADTVSNIYGITQSRINLMSGSQASGAGWNYVVHDHYSGRPGKSQFTISQSELKTLLQSSQVVKSPIAGTLSSAKGERYIREVDLGSPIGTDKFSNHQPTSVMTILTDKHGNLNTATPGRIK